MAGQAVAVAQSPEVIHVNLEMSLAECDSDKGLSFLQAEIWRLSCRDYSSSLASSMC